MKRAIWPYLEKGMARDFVACARVRRNLYVHSAHSIENPDQAAYLIKTIIEPHLLSLIRNDFEALNLEEYGHHLSLPSDLKTLERNKKWIDKALRTFRRPTKGQ
jgi:hypothetical protein